MPAGEAIFRGAERSDRSIACRSVQLAQISMDPGRALVLACQCARQSGSRFALMRIRPLSIIAAAVCLIASSGCENLTPEGNAAVFGTAAGLATGIPLAASGVDSRIAVPAAFGAAALAAGVSYVIAKHQATERQRKIAEQRARLYMAERAAAQQRATRSAAASASQRPKKDETAAKPIHCSQDTERAAQQGPIRCHDLRYSE